MPSTRQIILASPDPPLISIISSGLERKDGTSSRPPSRDNILKNWRTLTPEEIVAIFRAHYRNISSLSVMISQMKKQLKQLPVPPGPTYLNAIALQKHEYNEIRNAAKKAR